jgi:hypothetical protein
MGLKINRLALYLVKCSDSRYGFEHGFFFYNFPCFVNYFFNEVAKISYWGEPKTPSTTFHLYLSFLRVEKIS